MRTFDFTVQASRKWPATLAICGYLGVLTALIISQWDLFQPLVLNGNRVIAAGVIVLLAAPPLLFRAVIDSQRTLQIGQDSLVVSNGRQELARIALADIGQVRVTKLARCLEVCDRAGHLRICLNCSGLSNPSDEVLDELLTTLPARETCTEGRVQELRWTDRSAEFLPV